MIDARRLLSARRAKLLDRGWAVTPGERYRFRTSSGIRVTTAALEPAEARALAAAIDEAVNGATATYAG
jgi:hypothetical protein